MKNNTRRIAKIGLIAALYAVITLALGFISYGPIQFRVAEIMTLLPLLGKEYIVALTLGCFLANVIGPYGMPDIIFGTLATFIAGHLVYLTRKTMKDKKGYVLIASLWPTIVNAIIVGITLNVFAGLPLIISILEVGIGEFVVITIIGVPLFKAFKEKYSKLLKDF